MNDPRDGDVRGVDHVAIAVRDIGTHLGFFRDQLRLPVVHDEVLVSPPVRLLHLHASDIEIQLVQPLGPGRIATFIDEHGEGFHHICFRVPRIDAAVMELGLAVAGDVFVGGRGHPACFLDEHPQGVEIELMEPRPRSTEPDTTGPAGASRPETRRRVVVFDDDPTGTQTVSDVDIILDRSEASLETAFATADRPVYVLTNSRSLPERQAVDRVRELGERVASVARRHGESVDIILRGDSTLRGHVFAEIDALAGPDAVVLFVPAFLEGGRTTVAGEHRVRIEGIDTNVADTEFARDATFGFRSRRLVDWVAEVGRGRRARIIALDELRASGGAALGRALLDAPPGEVVIPEIADQQDVLAAVHGLSVAEAAGRRVVVRSAATFMAARAGLRARSVDRVDLGPAGRVLIVCGSHTQASGAQLAVLARADLPTHIVAPEDSIGEATALVRRTLDLRHAAVIASPREFVQGTGLVAGGAFLDALVAIVEQVAQEVDAVIAKGGITSARVAEALGAGRAHVEGQLHPGVALWTLDLPGRGLPYVVVPGNVGEPATLADILGRMGMPVAQAAMPVKVQGGHL